MLESVAACLPAISLTQPDPERSDSLIQIDLDRARTLYPGNFPRLLRPEVVVAITRGETVMKNQEARKGVASSQSGVVIPRLCLAITLCAVGRSVQFVSQKKLDRPVDT